MSSFIAWMLIIFYTLFDEAELIIAAEIYALKKKDNEV